MSIAEPACYSTPEQSGLRVETLPFEQIPHQSRLFLDYLKDPVALRKYYPSAVRSHQELPQRIPEVLAAYKVDRSKVCDALAASNERWGAGEATLSNIQLLSRPDCITVVSGLATGQSTIPQTMWFRLRKGQFTLTDILHVFILTPTVDPQPFRLALP